jgi:dTDP-glucose 4,6-dehydratase
MSEKILIIGANSFTGIHLASSEQLQKYHITLASRNFDIDKVFVPKILSNQNLNHIKVNFQDQQNFSNFIESIKGERYKFIYNFLSMSMVSESWTNPEKWYEVNVNKTANLIDTIIENDLCEKYIHISTPEVYGNTPTMILEDSYFSPSTPYAISRLAGDLHLKAKAKLTNFPFVITRSANVCGPRQPLYRIIPKAIMRALSNKKLLMHGGGISTRSFIHVDDVISGTISAAENLNFCGTVHFATNEYISILELLNKISNRLGLDFKDWVEFAPDRPGKDLGYRLDTTRALKELNWTPKFNLDSTIDDCINWVEQNFDKLIEFPQEYQPRS